MTIQKKVLEIAEKEGYGVKETEGQNAGPQVRKYLKAVNINIPAPWCAAFVVWALKETLKENFNFCMVSSGYCPTLSLFAEQKNILSNDPEPGDIFLVYDDISAYHTGFVLSLPNNTQFKTCEGNSNSNGSSNGDGIYSNIRTIGNNYRFIKWHRLLSEPEKKETKYFELYLKDKKICDCPIIDNAAFAPVREFAEALGIKISKVDNKSKKVFI